MAETAFQPNPLDSDAGTISYYDSKVHEKPFESLHDTGCSTPDSILEAGSGGVVEANGFHGQQIGGQRTPDASSMKLRGW